MALKPECNGGPSNPPAFPRPAGEDLGGMMSYPQEGMTLRDYFAAKAMQHLLVGEYRLEASSPQDDYARKHAEQLAKRAFQIADAMLMERSK